MNLLEAVTETARETGYKVDSVVVGSTETTTKQIWAICNRVIREMADEYLWPVLTKEYVFTTSDGVSTYAMPADLNWQIDNTHFNRTTKLRLYGSVTPEERQMIKSGYAINNADSTFTIRSNTTTTFEIFPTPSSTQTLSFEYASTRCVKPRTWATAQEYSLGAYTFYNGNYYTCAVVGGTGGTGATPPTHTTGTVSDGNYSWAYYSGDYSTFVADTDEPVLPSRIFSLGVFERFAEYKGLTFTPRYSRQLALEAAKSKPNESVSMAYGAQRRMVGITRLIQG